MSYSKIELLRKASTFDRKVNKNRFSKNFCLKPLAEVFVSFSFIIWHAKR